jgi:hypothetical protein
MMLARPSHFSHQLPHLYFRQLGSGCPPGSAIRSTKSAGKDLIGLGSGDPHRSLDNT